MEKRILDNINRLILSPDEVARVRQAFQDYMLEKQGNKNASIRYKKNSNKQILLCSE